MRCCSRFQSDIVLVRDNESQGVHVPRLSQKEFEDIKGLSESINQRTDNTMARKKYKRTNNDLQNIHIKLKIE